MTLPTFTTPEPIEVTIKLAVGKATIVASERGDTVVTVAPYDVAPHDPALDPDVRSARSLDLRSRLGRISNG